MSPPTHSLPLFYAAGAQQVELMQLVLGVIDPVTLGHDVVAFDGEEGGTAERELAIPFLDGMDEVVVDRAELRLRAVSDERSVAGWEAIRVESGADAGYVVRLDRPGRLSTVTLDVPAFGGGRVWPGVGADRLRLVVRPAEPSGGGFDFGPPIFADPSFGLPSPLYPPVLGGMTVTEVWGGLKLRVPDVAGTAWLVQFATGEDATALTPHPYTSVVRDVTVDASCSELALVIPGGADAGGEDVTLWSYPSPFLPDVGEQVVSFTPIAQRRLAAGLADGASGPTLPVPLRFSSASGGKVAVTGRALEAHYEVDPVAAVPMPLALGRGWSEVALSAPAGRRPGSARARAVVRHLGRELNGGSPLPPRRLPGLGVRVDGGRWAARRVALEPVGDAIDGAAVPVAAVSVLVEADAGTELAVELRPDLAGSPGPPPPAPLVHQVETAVRGWVELTPATPVELPPGPCWVALRTTRGSLHWFTHGAGVGRVSIDEGETWGDVDPRLAAPEAPVTQLYHALPELPEALPRPGLTAQLGDVLVAADLLAGAIRAGPREFVLDPLLLPDAVLAAIGATTGAGRAATALALFSRAVAELTLEDAALTYDPLAA